MLHRFTEKRIAREEHRLGVPLDHLRYLADHARPILGRLLLALSKLRYRRALPAATYAVARLVATRRADCGPCVQIEVTLARRENIEPTVLRAVLDDRPDALPPDLADVYHFAHDVCAGQGGDAKVRERIRERFGHRGLIELALDIAFAHFFPVLKRALGYAEPCRLVRLDLADEATALLNSSTHETAHEYG